ncbi:hypothetical protein V9T40_011437 [Parthenolecanium corni]|uniref:Inositol-1-monophosphatase n=1 Tax=Parthenolecanium corni TaxID=536013 RepID=A0AAN9TK79_9HEMI
METELEKYMSCAMELTKQSSQLIRDRIWSEKKDIQTKSHRHDFVTETDQEIEKLLITGLSSQFPDHKFIGEETTSSGVKAELTDKPTWIIDPVDGTLNFVHGYPNVCISIGLAINKEVVLGIISVPVPNLMFSAVKGCGAFLNGNPIHVSGCKDIKDALLALELSGAAGVSERIETCKKLVATFLQNAHGVRSAGSAAYNMATVALGGADCYFEIGIHAWDMAAGDIIVREAGGVVIDPSGGKFDIMSRRVICASSMELALQVGGMVDQHYPERDDA